VRRIGTIEDPVIRSASKLRGMSRRSVFLRGLVALFVTLVLSVAFSLVIGHPERMVLTWELSFAIAWVAWVWLPERRKHRNSSPR
jgi:hypothetical protein